MILSYTCNIGQPTETLTQYIFITPTAAAASIFRVPLLTQAILGSESWEWIKGFDVLQSYKCFALFGSIFPLQLAWGVLGIWHEPSIGVISCLRRLCSFASTHGNQSAYLPLDDWWFHHIFSTIYEMYGLVSNSQWGCFLPLL